MLSKKFEFTIRMSQADKDLFDKFDRPERIRELSRLARTIYKRMDPKWDGKYTIDHIDIDVTNNTRSNLRLATPLKQIRNRRIPRNNKSGHVGISHRTERNKVTGVETHSWAAQYRDTNKYFPYTDVGLKDACKYYRSIMRADGSTCETCHPDVTPRCDSKEEENLLEKTFQYEIKFSPEDRDLFDKWTRADDARTMSASAARQIAKRIGLNATNGLSVDHINQDMFDEQRVNLRLATAVEQIRNQRIPRTNTSGHKGVQHFKSQRGTMQYWLATYHPKGMKRKEKKFPFNDQGLKDACLYYRNTLRPDKPDCPTCNERPLLDEEIMERPAKRARTE